MNNVISAYQITHLKGGGIFFFFFHESAYESCIQRMHVQIFGIIPKYKLGRLPRQALNSTISIELKSHCGFYKMK